MTIARTRAAVSYRSFLVFSCRAVAAMAPPTASTKAYAASPAAATPSTADAPVAAPLDKKLVTAAVCAALITPRTSAFVRAYARTPLSNAAAVAISPPSAVDNIALLSAPTSVAAPAKSSAPISTAGAPPRALYTLRRVLASRIAVWIRAISAWSSVY